jgi:hypothetical protein
MRMNYATATLAVLLLACGGGALAAQMGTRGTAQPITANPLANPGMPGAQDTDLHAGIGVICNTRDQAEQYVRLRARGSRIAAAMNGVNQQSNDPKACGLAAVAYKRGETLDTKNLDGKSVDIVRIGVIAGYDGHGWTRMKEQMTQYAIIRSKGIAI